VCVGCEISEDVSRFGYIAELEEKKLRMLKTENDPGWAAKGLIRMSLAAYKRIPAPRLKCGLPTSFVCTLAGSATPLECDADMARR